SDAGGGLRGPAQVVSRGTPRGDRMTTDDCEGFDIQVLPGAKDLLKEIPRAARAVLGDRAIELFARQPWARSDTDRFANTLWREVRELTFDDTGRTIGEVMAIPE